MSNRPDRGTRPPRLIDVAHAAGVSVATASYVLSNRAGVTISIATRERVLEAAQSLGYRRNALAAMLRTGASPDLAIWSTGRPVGEMVDVSFALVEAARRAGFSTILHIGHEAEFEPGRYAGVLTLGPAGEDLRAALDDAVTPYVEIGSSQGRCQVQVDEFGGARKAVEQFLALGHRRIGHLAGPQADEAARERMRGYLDAVSEAGLRMDATPVYHTSGELANGLAGPSRPSAILAFVDIAAANAYQCAWRAGLRIPEDLSVIGFGDGPIAAGLEPPLTSVRVDPDLVAGAAVALIERQRRRELVPTETLVPTSISVRSSAAQV